MKKGKLFIKLAITSVLFVSFFTSCASSDNQEPKNQEVKPFTEEISEPEIPQPTAEELFLEQISEYKLSFTNIPGKIKKGKSFSSAFEVTVLNKESEPAADFDVCFLYPSGKSGSELVYENIVIKTNEEGIASYTPGNISFAAKAKVTAYPAIPEDLSLEDSIEELAVPKAYADFLVESDVATKGAIMFVFEYTESGKPSKNSYEILSALRKKGVSQIGNAPISDTDYINASKEKIYKENYSYVGTDFGYLIGGTIKFSSPVEQTENGYIATLCADIYGIDMKTGKVIYENKHETQAVGTNWNYAVSNCREALTKIVVDSIMFGL